MAILKAPPAQTKNETIQLRVSQEMKLRLGRYAEFIHANTSYIVVEALNRIFDKDQEFKAWLEQHPDSESLSNSGTQFDVSRNNPSVQPNSISDRTPEQILRNDLNRT